jgi:hypothetical protein
MLHKNKVEEDAGESGATSANDEDPRSLAQARALEAKKRARKVVNLLEESLKLVAEDDPTQPSTKYVYAALNEAERRAMTLEDWYQRTYRERLS